MNRALAALAVVVLALASCGGPTETTESGSPLTLRDVDGGPGFYSRFSPSLPDSNNFYPIGIWASSVVDDTRWPTYKAAGVNTYVEPTADSDLARIGASGMYVLSSRSDGPTNGRFTTDEVDMWGGPGEAEWTGDFPGDGEICAPSDQKCGYTVMSALESDTDRNRLTYTNYGKSVLFWGTDEQSGRFVNDYQDVVSADAYWFTDPNICAGTEGGSLIEGGNLLSEDVCRRAANYGATVDRVRSLVQPPASKPVWAFVEVGQPFSTSTSPITPPEMASAVWSSVIHGARGVVYFNHNFGGECQSQHVLLDCGTEMLDSVGVVSRRIADLAPVLNAPFVDGFVSRAEGLDTMAKWSDGSVHVFALPTGSAEKAKLEVVCHSGSSAEVLGESRTVPITNGAIEDDFADAASMHVYRIDPGQNCGPDFIAS